MYQGHGQTMYVSLFVIFCATIATVLSEDTGCQYRICGDRPNVNCSCTILPHKVSNLDEVYIANCAGRTLTSAAICLGSNPIIKTIHILDLCKTELKAVRAADFATISEGLQDLLDMQLCDNKIESIDDEALFPLQSALNFDRLNFSGNSISKIGERAFIGVENIRDLDLSRNKLTEISVNPFINMTDLVVLDLSNNPLTKLNDKIFSTLYKLDTLRMTNTQLTSLDQELFHGLIKLTELDLRNNRLESVPQFHDLGHLTSLDLSGNNFVTIEVNAFSKTALTVLKLNNLPKLTTIAASAFGGIISLETLEIQNCPKLSDIDAGAFGNTPKSFNKLQKFSLANNALTTLSSTMLDWVQIKNLSLDGNQWVCNCKLTWMTTMNFTSEILCDSPAKMKNLRVNSLKPEEMTCDSFFTAIRQSSGRLVFGVTLLVVVIATLISVGYCCFVRGGQRWRPNFSAVRTWKPQRTVRKYVYRKLVASESSDNAVLVDEKGYQFATEPEAV